jgi:hypothetical protein
MQFIKNTIDHGELIEGINWTDMSWLTRRKIMERFQKEITSMDTSSEQQTSL